MQGDKLGSCAITGSSLQIRAHLLIRRYLSTISSSRTWFLLLALPLADGKFINVPIRSSCFLTHTNVWTCSNFRFLKCLRSTSLFQHFNTLVVQLWDFEITSACSYFFKMSQCCCTVGPPASSLITCLTQRMGHCINFFDPLNLLNSFLCVKMKSKKILDQRRL